MNGSCGRRDTAPMLSKASASARARSADDGAKTSWGITDDSNQSSAQVGLYSNSIFSSTGATTYSAPVASVNPTTIVRASPGRPLS